MSTFLILMLALASAHAELPLPDYDRTLARARWHQVNAIIETACGYDMVQKGMACTEDVGRAITLADDFQRTVMKDAGIEYLAALAHKLSGQQAKAKRRYRAALALDAELTEGWYDLGEILLVEGDFPGADDAFERVAALVPQGPRAWLGPWRRAEVAAHQRDIEAFELHMREALRRGFSFEEIRGLPNWRAFYADPDLRDSINKLITVYGTPSVLESLLPDPD